MIKQKNKGFYYTTDYGEKIYLMDYQAEEIYRQREAYYKACDMMEMIKDEFSDNKQLMELTTDDLLEYADVFADQMVMYEDMDAYWNICRIVIEDFILKDLKEKQDE